MEWYVFSVETRKVRGGKRWGGHKGPILLVLAWFGEWETSLPGPQDPLQSVPLWPPDRLFTEQSQRAQNVPASSTPPDPLPQGTGLHLGAPP